MVSFLVFTRFAVTLGGGERNCGDIVGQLRDERVVVGALPSLCASAWKALGRHFYGW